MSLPRNPIWRLGLLLGLLAIPAPATAGAVDQARTLFHAGAQAYEQHDYPAAIAAFGQAYALVKRPGLQFSIGQAYRRQYYLDSRPENLRQAIAHYRRYRELRPQGPRAADAAQALGELGPIADKLAATTAEGGESGTPQPAEAAASQTRLMVPARIKGAHASLDGGKPAPLPLIAQVTPGKHIVVVSRPGYFDERREAVAAAGSVTALDINLRPKPALVTVATDAGAGISVDGRPVGSAPLLRPLELPAGTHLLTAALNGHRGYAEEITVGRGEQKKLDAALPVSTQRYFAYGIMAVGTAGLCAGGVFTALAVHQENVAVDIEQSAEVQDINAAALATHNTAIDRRGRFTTAAVFGFAGGAAVGLTGLLLYAFDSPRIEAPLRRGGAGKPDVEPDSGPPPAQEPTMEMGALPVVLPHGAAVVLSRRF